MSFKFAKSLTLTPTTTVAATLDLASVQSISQIIIQPETTSIRWTDDPNFALSSTVGMVLAAGDTLVFQGDWKNFRCMAASGTPNVWVYVYRGGLG
jgi:ABC-type uncharacterized transport system YnjBCD permease subunit